ncbi:phosphate transport system permease protein [Meinhardsimonia xiamenensis]|jgi:phosphate transport system permease protein|uniref:Phosphate transport system permease protein PstA n=1 Tax=Meinhardsimonia xiamenensis TaxID=990712 RepID=A0A1G9H4C9_9RHOB|nr:phosphate ABC transporter permease PstA [Meinhardsimonia xiamenensis]PRX29785.1 phosphate transport system permease protein [Meinhardsimonia xiamenensis]SDL07817.1 phosphate transport system permease protein [Meinhardsimonia xiamenensis]
MTDTTPTLHGIARPSAQEAARHLARRKRRQRRLVAYGLAAIAFAFLMLAILVGSLVVSGAKAFVQTHVTLEVFVDPAEIRADRLPRGGFKDVLQAALQKQIPGIEDRKDAKRLLGILSNGAQFMLRDMVVADPSLIGETIKLTVPVSDPYDQLAKGEIDPETPEEFRRLKDDEIAWFRTLEEKGLVSMPFNWALFTNADSRFPELAGLKGALMGSFWALLVCFVISFPLGIGAAIYLEEFGRKNRVADIIEVNINNLAAVPSVVFGLLALAVFLGWFGLPRSAPLVGGMTLALMTLPTIIIATRAALKAVPPSIREAALGVGASNQQVVFHHVLPLAMPGILTGTIIGLAQALGETAPLLLIGMNAFITSAPASPMDAATALPTQIFIWADSPERGFVARTSAAILVLLGFLIAMNALAIFLRARFERKW